MAISKIVYKEDANATPVVWMDTTDKTANSGNMLNGITALKNDGTTATGNIASKTSSDLQASGATVTAPAGYYASSASKSVSSGSATTPATTVTANPSISVGSDGLITATASATKSVTPTVSAGYVSSGTAGTITVSGSNTSQLTTQAAQTIYPSTSDQTIASGKYLTGAQTFAGVLLTNLSAGNIKKDVVVKVGDSADDDRITSVTGTYEGSGGGGLTLLATDEVTVNTTSTSWTTEKTISLGQSAFLPDKLLCISIRDKAGARDGYFLGSDTFYGNDVAKNNNTTGSSTNQSLAHTTYYYASGAYKYAPNGYGVQAYQIQNNQGAVSVVIASRYSSTNSKTINGTYGIKVYAIDINPFG